MTRREYVEMCKLNAIINSIGVLLDVRDEHLLIPKKQLIHEEVHKAFAITQNFLVEHEKRKDK